MQTMTTIVKNASICFLFHFLLLIIINGIIAVIYMMRFSFCL